MKEIEELILLWEAKRKECKNNKFERSEARCNGFIDGVKVASVIYEREYEKTEFHLPRKKQ